MFWRLYKVPTFSPQKILIYTSLKTQWKSVGLQFWRNYEFDSLRAQHFFPEPHFSLTPFDLESSRLQPRLASCSKDADYCSLERGCLFLFPGPISLLLYYTNHIELLMLHGEMSALELWPFSAPALYSPPPLCARYSFSISTAAWRWPAFCSLSFCDNVDYQGAVEVVRTKWSYSSSARRRRQRWLGLIN